MFYICKARPSPVLLFCTRLYSILIDYKLLPNQKVYWWENYKFNNVYGSSSCCSCWLEFGFAVGTVKRSESGGWFHWPGGIDVKFAVISYKTVCTKVGQISGKKWGWKLNKFWCSMIQDLFYVLWCCQASTSCSCFFIFLILCIFSKFIFWYLLLQMLSKAIVFCAE